MLRHTRHSAFFPGYHILNHRPPTQASASSLFLSPTNNTNTTNTIQHRNHGLRLVFPDHFNKIHLNNNTIPNSTLPPSVLLQDLNFSSSRNVHSSSFTTDSAQSPWPSHFHSARPLATQNAQHQTQQPSDPPSQQDFVLFPSHSQQATPSAQNTLNQPIRSAPGYTNRRHSSHLASGHSLQNPRVAAISHAKGTGNSSTALNLHRYNPNVAQNHFYASSAQSSPLASYPQRTRPPVPLFSQSTSNLPHRNTQTVGAMAAGSFTSLL